MQRSGSAYLALGQLGFDGWPCLALGSIAEQVHDNRTSFDSFINVKQISVWNPAICFSFLPRSTILSDTDDDIESIVAQIQALSVTLRSVTDQRKGVILEVVLHRSVLESL